ncbi:MAG: RNA polymerase factor sigma-54 [Bacteroidetes bacterium]|nr:RNA polymerase factor sigma-54 [Bacteroidota bacterium]
MALKNIQQLKLQQKLLPQQIMLMKLLQLPTLALEERIKEELEANPALEEENEQSSDDELYENNEPEKEQEIDENGDPNEDESQLHTNDVEMEDYMDAEELDSYKYEISNKGADDVQREFVVVEGPDFYDLLEQQLYEQNLSEQQFTIGIFLIGSLDEDGYLRRELDSVTDDLAFKVNINATLDEVKTVLKVIQNFDPPGVGAQTLQECLLIQLKRKAEQTREVRMAIDIVSNHMDDFSKKHYEKITRKLGIDNEELKDVIEEIKHLNPKPGNTNDKATSSSEIIPDFIININDSKPEISINGRNLPDLKISNEYLEMLKEYSKSKDKQAKEATGFIKGKIEGAEWFIEALQQRYNTMLLCMHAIVEFQKEYFITGDEKNLKPMILKDVATKVNLDLSTISRVANSKYVQTPYGTFSLKSFFSEAMSKDDGEEISSREVKKIIKEVIEQENKHNPYTDDELCNKLKEKGYAIARRTVAKYREQMEIPVGRLRKEV